MYEDATLHWMTANPTAARAIVGLAGIRTHDAHGIDFDVTARWTGNAWEEPILYRVKISEGYYSWRVSLTGSHTLLFHRTLESLSETFESLKIPPSIIIFHGVVDERDKKPHFVKFEAIRDIPLKDEKPCLWISGDKDDTSSEFASRVRSLLDIRRRLEGMGY